MKILALEKEVAGVTADRFTQQIKQAEALKAWELHQEGVIRELYFRQDESSAVLMLECDDTDQAEEILKTLPMVAEGLIAFDLIPLVAYPGFARLFRNNA